MKAELNHGSRIEILAETEEELAFVDHIKSLPIGSIIPKAVLTYEVGGLYFYFTDENDSIQGSKIND